MVVAVLTTTGAGTWTVPGDCPAGTSVTVETWGAGSGGSGTGSTNGGGGGGGAYASSNYVVDPNDVASGVAYTIGVGGNGGTGVGSLGGDTSFSTNNLNMLANGTGGGSNINKGAVVGSPGTIPDNWHTKANLNGLTRTIVGFGTDTASGFPYIDIRFNGTTNASSNIPIFFDGNIANTPASASTQYTLSCYWYIVAGSAANITSFAMQWDTYNTGATYLTTQGGTVTAPTGTQARVALTATTAATTMTELNTYVQINHASGQAIDITLRILGAQLEQAAAASFVKTCPGYTLAKGAAAPITTGGGVGGLTATSVGTAKFAGGNGRAYNVSGSPGGGGAGKNGAGTTASTTTSGSGNAGSGGAGVAVSSGTANPGTANVEGGSGGGAVTGVGGTGGVGGAPGGGGGGSDGASGTRTGGAGGRGQIRLTYTPSAAQIMIPSLNMPLSQRVEMIGY